MSPMKTSFGNRKSSQSEYDTANDDDELSDSSVLYHSALDITLENKENSMSPVKSAKKRTIATPLHRKLLQKSIKGSTTPRNVNAKRVSFHFGNQMPQDDSQQNAKTVAPISQNQKPKSELDNNEPKADEVKTVNVSIASVSEGDVTIVEAPKLELPQMRKPEDEITIFVTDEDDNKKCKLLDRIKLSAQKQKVLQPKQVFNANRLQRMSLAKEMKKARTSTVTKRSTMFQQRKTVSRRSMEFLKKTKLQPMAKNPTKTGRSDGELNYIFPSENTDKSELIFAQFFRQNKFRQTRDSFNRQCQKTNSNS